MLKFLLIFIPLVFSISCCFTNKYNNAKPLINKEKNIKKIIRPSVLHISRTTEIQVLNESETATISSILSLSVGTGSIINHNKNSTYILTAGHICSPLSLIEVNVRVSPEYLTNAKRSKSLYTVMNTYGDTYTAVILYFNTNFDTCILLTKKINIQEIKILDQEPEYGIRVFSISYAKGIWDKLFSPIYEGFFNGFLGGPNEKMASSFSLPTVGGCSGAPILDKNGFMVGMVHSYMNEFYHLTLGATVFQIKYSLDEAIIVYNKNQKELDTIISKINFP